MEIFPVLRLCRGVRFFFSAPRLEVIIIDTSGVRAFFENPRSFRTSRPGVLPLLPFLHCRGCGGHVGILGGAGVSREEGGARIDGAVSGSGGKFRREVHLGTSEWCGSNCLRNVT